ncbi:hypothetical protein BH11PAT1_BH11PAT1_3440 [soil metagenome]
MYNVVKANGIVEPFSEDKLISSIRRARVPEGSLDDTLSYIKSKLYNNITTAEIYHHITEHLGKSPHPYIKARYSLKQAIMNLGPTGYPFEDFVSKIFEEQGYTTLVRQVLMGKCVSHEVDVIAEKEGRKIVIEAKFHNNPGVRSDVHVALYTKARFDDVKEKHGLAESWIVTNTKATTDAIAYAECVGMKIVSWSYPEGESLRDLIERANLHPITMLTTLSLSQKQYLLENHFVMCKDIKTQPTIIDMLHLTREEKKTVFEEIDVICGNEKSLDTHKINDNSTRVTY